MPCIVQPPVPHHYELVAFKTDNPSEKPHLSKIARSADEIIEHLLTPLVEVKGRPHYTYHGDWLRKQGYRSWEIRPVYLTPRQQEAIWSANPTLQVTHPVKDYD